MENRKRLEGANIVFYDVIFKATSNEQQYILSNTELLVYAALQLHKNLKGEVFTSLYRIAEECGFHPQQNSSICTKISNALIALVSKRIPNTEFLCDTDIAHLKPKETFSLYMYQSENIVTEKFSFVTLYEWNKLTSLDFKNKGKLLKILLCVYSYIYPRNNSQSILEYPEAIALTNRTISDDSNSNYYRIWSLLNILEKAQLISIYRTGGYRTKNNTIRNAPNLYARYGKTEDLDAKLSLLKKYYRVKEFIPVDTKRGGDLQSTNVFILP